MMAVDDGDNKVDGNGATSDDDGYVSQLYSQINYIANFLQYNFYRQRLLPPGEQTPRGSRAGVMRENFQGGAEDSSPACCSSRVLLTP